MPTKTDDPTKRYSDSELDPSNSAFQGIVDNYGATADPTQENQNIANAQNLKDQEASPQSAKSAASANEKSLANPYKYSPGSKKESFTARLSGNKKKIAALGGGGALGAGILALFFTLLPLKIPGIMQMIADEAAQRVEQATEKRAQILVGRYILRHAGSNTVITGEGPIATLMASMRTTRFEKKLEQKGLKIERRDGGVRLTLDDGTRLGDGQTFRNEAAIIRALESNNITNKMLKDVVKEEIPSWRWMKRAKFAKWLRIKYGIPRFGIENSKESDTEKKIAEMNANRLNPEYQALTSTLGDATSCMMSADCDTNAYGSEPTTAADAIGEAAQIEETANDAAEELIDEVSADPSVNKTLISQIIDKLGTKAIPIIGWIDLVATVDHIAYEAIENDYYGKLASLYRAQLYARHYGVWSGYGSQIQLGAMDPEFIGVLAQQTEGIEESQAFSLIEGQPDDGKKVVNKINQNNTTEIVERFREFSAMTGMGYEGLQGKTAHFVLNAYYETLGGGGLLGWLSEQVGEIAGAIFEKLTPEAAQEKLAELIQFVMSKLLDVMGLDFDPLVKGADWFNAAHGGATWSYNDFCKSELGCRKLSASQASLQNNLIAAERAEYRSQQGVLRALFDNESSTSIPNQVAIHMPTNAAAMLTNIGSMITSAPSNLIKGLTHKTSAAGYTDIHGVDPYGATSDELNQPVDSRAANNEDCGESDGNTTNLCQMDKAIAAAMLCEFEPESAECSDVDGATTESSDEGATFTIASFNIFKSDGQTPEQWQARLRRSVNTLTENNVDIAGFQEGRPNSLRTFKTDAYGGLVYDMWPDPNESAVPIVWNKSKFSKVGEQFIKATYRDGVGNYNVPVIRLKSNQTGQEFYVINTHDPADDAHIRTRYDNAVRYAAALNKLEADGLPIFFTGDFNSGYSVRSEGNLTYENKRANLTYCVLTRESKILNAYDVYKNRSGVCPTEGVRWDEFDNFSHANGNAVDHIYVSREVRVDKFFRAEAGRGKNGSDVHDTIMATVTIPGKNSANAGNWSWPVDKKWWDSNRSDFLGSHPSTGTAWGGDNMGTTNKGAGIASDIGDPPDGSPVYAMIGGTVTSTNLCGAGDGVAIKSKVGGATVGIAYMHGFNQKVKVGDVVKSGQHIMDLGAIGCNVYGGHLHLGIAYNGRYVCPQDIFLALDKGQTPNLNSLVRKAVAPCVR